MAKTTKPTTRGRKSAVKARAAKSETAVSRIQASSEMRWSTLIIVLMAILVAFGLFLIFSDKSDSQSPLSSNTEQSGEISYKGVEGKTALEILKDTHQVETQSYEGLGEIVIAIDGIKPDGSSYWIYYVNGEQATEGAGTYVTDNDETITWKLEKAQ